MLNTKTVIDMAGRDLPQKYTPVAFCLGVRLESELPSLKWCGKQGGLERSDKCQTCAGVIAEQQTGADNKPSLMTLRPELQAFANTQGLATK
jgi:hypothetical protein